MKTLQRFTKRSFVFLISILIIAGLTVSLAPFSHANAAAASSVNQGDSYNWSGYVNTGHTFNKVQGDITLPTVSCTQSGAEALFWVGLDGYANSTTEQDGIGVKCIGSTPSYFGWWEMYHVAEHNDATSLQQVKLGTLDLNAGDRLATTVSYVTLEKSGKKYGAFEMTIDNTSVKSHSFETTQTCATGYTCSRSSAEWIAERYQYDTENKTALYYPLAKFGYNSDLFTYAESTTTTNSTLEPITANPTDELDMIENNTGDPLANAGALHGNGTEFGVTWVATK